MKTDRLLTPREREILGLLAIEGLTVKQVADRMCGRAVHLQSLASDVRQSRREPRHAFAGELVVSAKFRDHLRHP